MEQITWPGGMVLDYCSQSRGLWLDQGELKALLKEEGSLKIELGRNLAPSSSAEPAKTAFRSTSGTARSPLPPRPGLLPLPNLFLRSMITLAGLYALLGAALIAAVEFAGVPLDLAVWTGVGVIVLQFLVGPYIMDLSLRWMYQFDWVTPSQLPPHLAKFVARVCTDQQMKFPRFGIIADGAPQAFTYGHAPNDARIVLSRGILELLAPREVEAVVAHELGHAVHWDMVLMTIAQVVPLVLYYTYKKLSQARDRDGDKEKLVAMIAYVLYIISEYVVLWFSRTREYNADRFSGTVTGNPSQLASALVKIAYGLAGQEPKRKEPKDDSEDASSSSTERSLTFEAVGALGIFDGNAARSLAVAGYSETSALTGEVDPLELKNAMRWDLWNPWAKWCEIHSTHPLVAKRLQYLSNHAAHLGHEPYIVFDDVQPESYWDDFIVDLSVDLLPIASLMLVPTYWLFFHQAFVLEKPWLLFSTTLIAVGLAMLFKFKFRYPGGYFPKATVSSLLKHVKVSDVRPVPCRLSGTIIGRGIPGYIFSEDFVLKDQTGIIFLDYQQPLEIWEVLFGLLKAGQYQGKQVEVTGWYFRAPVPYVQIDTLTSGGAAVKSWVPTLYRLTATAVVVAGLLWAMFLRGSAGSGLIRSFIEPS